MPVDATGRWNPKTSPKQDELRDACRKYRFPAANGPRFSGKTIGCEHAFVEHGWNTPRGNDCIITISQTVGLDSGIWKEFTESIIPEWIDGDFGLRWVRKPYTMGVSKKPTCEITNRSVLELSSPDSMSESELREAGATTTFQLESLKVEDEAEDRFKPRKYTGMYVPELTTFLKRGTFDTWTECLRLKDPPKDTHFLFLSDFNPPDSSSYWISDIFWTLSETGESDAEILQYLRETHKDIPEETLHQLIAPTRVLKNQVCRIDIRVEDNPFADPGHVAMLKAKYAHNDDLYRRYILGERVETTEGSLFVKVFRPLYHVVGEIQTAGNKTPEIIVPSENTFELITGLDPGPRNFAFHVIEKVFPDPKLFPQYKGKAVFNILDEFIIVDEDFDLQDCIEAMVKKMEKWQKMAGRDTNMLWKHWSDRSVFDMRIPFSDRYWHEEIAFLSQRKIEVMAAARGKGSVNLRIELLRKLLFEDRVFINKNYCPQTIDMIKGIKKGVTVAGGIARGSKLKHAFDSLTYPLSEECFEELAQSVITQIMNLKNKDEGKNGSLVSVSL